jgi:hypothetical protein
MSTRTKCLLSAFWFYLVLSLRLNGDILVSTTSAHLNGVDRDVFYLKNYDMVTMFSVHLPARDINANTSAVSKKIIFILFSFMCSLQVTRI